MKIDRKEAVVAELSEVVSKSVSVIAAHYRGLSVADMTKLRTNARKVGVHMKVYRNTLARRAVENTSFACLAEVLTGPMVLMFSVDEPGAAARVLRDFVKESEKFQVRALVLDGTLLGPDQLAAVASLPSRHEALTKLAIVMNAPVTKLARTLQETYAQVARVMAAVRDKKQAA